MHSIFLVEDDPDDREFLKQALQEAGSEIELVEVSCGEVALRQLSEMKTTNELPCLMVLDINMPGMDGRELAIAIGADEELKNIPLVIFTMFLSPSDKLFFEQRNIEVIEKPFDIQKLRNVASKLLTYCKVPHEKK